MAPSTTANRMCGTCGPGTETTAVNQTMCSAIAGGGTGGGM
jgi:hypothetical protein